MASRRSGPVLAVLGAVLMLGLAAPPGASTPTVGAPSGGSLGVRLSEVPADTQDDPRARLYLIDHLAPGTTITRRIEVSNSGQGTLPVRLYPAAASVHAGAFQFAPGDTANSLTSWTSLDPAVLDVAGDAAAGATVRIAVPADAAPGEHYAVIWAEPATDSAATPAGVQVRNRVGIRVYLSVGPGGSPEAAFRIEALTAERDDGGHPVVLATVHNTGGRALDLSGTLSLGAGPAGLSAGPFPAQLGTTLAPGETEPVRFTLDPQLPAGPWEAAIELRSGLVQETATATITFPAAGAAPPVPTNGGAGWTPWLATGMLLVTVVIAAARRRRHRRAEADAGHASGVTAHRLPRTGSPRPRT